MEEKKILVIGGNGKTGRKVVERLNELGKSVHIGSRNENPSFDWERPETWVNALDGIDSVYITYQPDLAVPGARKSIEDFTSLAVKSGVRKLVLLSGKGEKAAELCEEVVKKSGAEWTIVRASWFNQNFSESFFLDPIKAGHVALPKAETLIPFVDTDDIADVAVKALLNEKHNGKTYELTGPRQLTFKQIIEEISESTGRNINFDSITMDEYKRLLSENDVPEDYIWLINYLFTEVLVEKNSVITHDIKKVLGRKAKDFSEYVKETAATGIWDSF
jgi:uncharacterized protein YbjT (DUF2867 family)